MVLNFRGTAHPAPGLSSPDPANLNAAEISITDMGRSGGTPLLWEHNAGHRIGQVQASWEGANGELRVAGVINDVSIERSVLNGKSRGLSLGTDCVSDITGKTLYKSQHELSVCDEPRRPHCYIDVIDGKSVRSNRRFSASGARYP